MSKLTEMSCSFSKC